MRAKQVRKWLAMSIAHFHPNYWLACIDDVELLELLVLLPCSTCDGLETVYVCERLLGQNQAGVSCLWHSTSPDVQLRRGVDDLIVIQERPQRRKEAGQFLAECDHRKGTGTIAVQKVISFKLGHPHFLQEEQIWTLCLLIIHEQLCQNTQSHMVMRKRIARDLSLKSLLLHDGHPFEETPVETLPPDQRSAFCITQFLFADICPAHAAVCLGKPLRLAISTGAKSGCQQPEVPHLIFGLRIPERKGQILICQHVHGHHKEGLLSMGVCCGTLGLDAGVE
mmetsp:Transcript_62989/g.115901  ORF Transcript_62989/g.115901 Transcript_62989/m.115901 type:complete len:280 (+) Transcript_62989:291-1130(+)